MDYRDEKGDYAALCQPSQRRRMKPSSRRVLLVCMWKRHLLGAAGTTGWCYHALSSFKNMTRHCEEKSFKRSFTGVESVRLKKNRMTISVCFKDSAKILISVTFTIFFGHMLIHMKIMMCLLNGVMDQPKGNRL